MQSNNNHAHIKFDLGLKQLLSEWKLLFSTKYLRDDLVAGVSVACVTIPLSLAIALASGVDPALGLVSAIVGGVVCALFGGTPFAVSGPAAAMAVIVGAVVQKFGLAALLFVTFGCGVLQLLTGFLGLGRVIRFVPVSVVAGFTAGIGAIILIAQLPRALGLPSPDEAHVIEVITHIGELIYEMNWHALGLALSTLGITFFLPRLWPKMPAALIAVFIPTLVVYFFDTPVQLIGNIPRSLPAPQFPTLPTHITQLLGTSFLVYMVASLETLLSSSAADQFSKLTEKHDSDQELIGQGLGNIFTSFFGGIPVTGVIARTSLNIQAGAKTRRSALFHALALICVVYGFAPFMSRIPVAVLAGILLSVSLRMLHPRELYQIWRSSRSDAFIYLLTFFVIVFVDLLAGIQFGVVAALLIAAFRMGRSKTHIESLGANGPLVVELEGPLTFMSSGRLDSLRSALSHENLHRGLVIDFSRVDTIDASGASQLTELLDRFLGSNIKFVLKGLSPETRETLFSLELCKKITPHIASSELEVLSVLGQNSSGLDRLVFGVEKFRKELKSGYGVLFKSLAEVQTPHTLFITCSDSRINPNLITSTDPGELFIVRNVGNIVPSYNVDSLPAEGAAIEFAIGVLNVKTSVVCGHSGCGAMKAVMDAGFFSSENEKKFPSLVRWLGVARNVQKQLPKDASIKQAAELNSLLQLENLKTYPVVRERISSGELKLYAWFYDIGEAELEEWDSNQRLFVRIGSKEVRSLEKRIEAGVQFQAPKL
jgi:carbonic anhydrase